MDINEANKMRRNINRRIQKIKDEGFTAMSEKQVGRDIAYLFFYPEHHEKSGLIKSLEEVNESRSALGLKPVDSTTYARVIEDLNTESRLTYTGERQFQTRALNQLIENLNQRFGVKIKGKVNRNNWRDIYDLVKDYDSNIADIYAQEFADLLKSMIDGED